MGVASRKMSALDYDSGDGVPNVSGLTLEPLVAGGEVDLEESRKLVYKDGDFCLFRPHSVEEVESKDVMKIQEK